MSDLDDTIQFQDLNFKLGCLGDCGSKLNQLLLEQTNLNYFKHCDKLPRNEDVVAGKASKKCYQKLKFKTMQDEKQFCTLLKQTMKIRANYVSMGYD